MAILRQEKGMSPQETDAMVQVVDLIGRVATNDAQARQIMLEQQSWRAPLYLMQSLRCPVAPDLKAAALSSLKARVSAKFFRMTSSVGYTVRG